MKVIINGNLLDVITKEYEIDGKKGITHKLDVYCDGQLYKIAIPLEMVDSFKGLIGQAIELHCKIFVKRPYHLQIKE